MGVWANDSKDYSKMIHRVKYPEEITHDDLDIIYDKSIVFGIAGYNVDVKLLRKRIEYLAEGFEHTKFCIYGLDSTDGNTLYYYKKWAQEDDRVYLIPPIKLDDCSMSDLSRTVRIGKIRNEVLRAMKDDYFDKISHYHSFDYAIIYDADHQGPMSKLGLIDSIELIDSGEVDVVCAYGTVRNFGTDFLYDNYALRMPGAKRHMRGSILDVLQLKLENDVTIVDSGFSGAAIYRYDDLINYHYSEEDDICEHVGLHHEMRRDDLKICIYKPLHIHVGEQPSVG